MEKNKTSYRCLKWLNKNCPLLAVLFYPVFSIAEPSEDVTLNRLVAMPAVSLQEFLADHARSERVFGDAPKVDLQQDTVHKIISERLVSELVASEYSFASILGSPSKIPELATVLPRKTKLQQRAEKALAVQVVIPTGPIDDEGLEARLVPASEKTGFLPSGQTVGVGSSNPDLVFARKDRLNVALETNDKRTREPSLSLIDVEKNQFQILDSPTGLTFVPPTLVLPKVGAAANLKIMLDDSRNLQIFVRDADILQWDPQTHSVTALQGGKTEFYVVHNGRMYILPVSIDQTLESIELQVPNALVSLGGVLPGGLPPSALFSGLEDNLRRSTDSSAGRGPSLQASRAETARTLADAERERRQYTTSKENPVYESINLQIIDERSRPENGLIYPVIGTNVHVLGTDFTAQTDQTGHITIRDVPSRSRFWIAISDRSGNVAPGIANLDTGRGNPGVIRIRVLRSFALEAMSSITGAAPDANQATLCGTIFDKSKNGQLSGFSVSIDAPAVGPLYFNQLGLLDLSQRVTGPDGRYCFLNVQAGPVSIGVFDEGEALGAIPVALFAGRHREVDFNLSAVAESFSTRLAMMPTAHEQLSTDTRVANSLKSIDMIDLIPLGDDVPMMQLEPSLVSTSDPIMTLESRIWAYARAAEFEPVIYSYNTYQREHVTPLLPRGFIEDMALYAQVVHDPTLGTILAEYGGRNGNRDESVTFRLVDAYGQNIGEPWYYADQPNTKAIFFNVNPGVYSLLLETADGFWLGADTLLVYNETTTYIQVGSRLRYRQ